jgi:hypothetical protein
LDKGGPSVSKKIRTTSIPVTSTPPTQDQTTVNTPVPTLTSSEMHHQSPPIPIEPEKIDIEEVPYHSPNTETDQNLALTNDPPSHLQDHQINIPEHVEDHSQNEVVDAGQELEVLEIVPLNQDSSFVLPPPTRQSTRIKGKNLIQYLTGTPQPLPNQTRRNMLRAGINYLPHYTDEEIVEMFCICLFFSRYN